MNMIPDTFVGAFAQGDILQVLFVSILFGFACAQSASSAEPVARRPGGVAQPSSDHRAS